MTFTLFHNNNCSKSRACKEILKQNNVVFKIREYLKKPLCRNEIQDIINNIDGDKNELLRKPMPNLNEKGLTDYIFENPELLQRPIFFDGSKYIICRPPSKVFDFIRK